MARRLTRSQQMARIRGQNTKPELRLRRALWHAGMRYRVHYRTTAGRADLAVPRLKLAIFVDGCFWHGCPHHYWPPKSSRDFWRRKLLRVVNRDRRQTLELETQGWTVIRIWEHELLLDLPATVSRITSAVDRSLDRRLDWRVVKVEAPIGQRQGHRRFLQSLRDPGVRKQQVRARSRRNWPAVLQ